MGSFAERLQALTVQLPPFIMAVVFHEYAHGFIANKWGDTTAHDRGRLTLNPIPHIDPIGTLLFPIINMLSGISLLIGWARPVPIDPRRFRKPRAGLFCVSLAGPAMNVFLALISSAAFGTLYRWMPHDFYLFSPLIAMCYVSISLNYALGIFNLIPLPPLDGSKVVQSVLPIELARKYETLARYSFFILMALLLTGAFSFLAAPIEFLTNATLYVTTRLFHLSLTELPQ
ncbi:MAG: site-2 protease family protein [Oligoflexia bacterium]|nr:site-2 protease family protein [Oligoflexia bacterium]